MGGAQVGLVVCPTVGEWDDVVLRVCSFAAADAADSLVTFEDAGGEDGAAATP